MFEAQAFMDLDVYSYCLKTAEELDSISNGSKRIGAGGLTVETASRESSLRQSFFVLRTYNLTSRQRTTKERVTVVTTITSPRLSFSVIRYGGGTTRFASASAIGWGVET